MSPDSSMLVIYGTVGADIDLNGIGKVRFQRNMGIGNNTGPGVAVIWNPNLLLNLPDQLMDALTDWPAFVRRLAGGGPVRDDPSRSIL